MVANLEIEMIGRPDSLAGGVGRGWLTGFERSTMGDLFTSAGLPIVADARPSEQFFMRSDNMRSRSAASSRTRSRRSTCIRIITRPRTM
jgi:hypothetical protein